VNPSPSPATSPSVPAVPGSFPDIELLRLTIAGTTIDVDMNVIVLVLLVAVGFALMLVALRRSRQDRVICVNVDIPLGGIGRVTVKSDRDVACIAQQAWIEIVTRKAGLPIDEENDVVDEILSSWYELFRELRVLAKSVPAGSLRTRNARDAVDLLVRALNDGLRPALTRWQARFRAWYAEERKHRPKEEPQLVQRDFPGYAEMIGDIKTVNGQLRQFADALRIIAHDTPGRELKAAPSERDNQPRLRWLRRPSRHKGSGATP